MDRMVAGDRRCPVAREIGDVCPADVGGKTMNRWMLRANATAVLCHGRNDFVFAARGDSDDDVLSARTLNTVFYVRLRRDGAGTGQEGDSCQHQGTHTASENHGLYYSKGSATHQV